MNVLVFGDFRNTSLGRRWRRRGFGGRGGRLTWLERSGGGGCGGGRPCGRRGRGRGGASGGRKGFEEKIGGDWEGGSRSKLGCLEGAEAAQLDWRRSVNGVQSSSSSSFPFSDPSAA